MNHMVQLLLGFYLGGKSVLHYNSQLFWQTQVHWANGICRSHCFRESRSVPNFFTQGAIGERANPQTPLCCVRTSALLLHPCHCAGSSEPRATCCWVGRNRLWDSLSLLFLRLFFTCFRPIMVSILFFLFFFSLLSLISPLNLGAGFGTINHFAAMRKGYLLSVPINMYCYCCLLSCFFPLGVMLWF